MHLGMGGASGFSGDALAVFDAYLAGVESPRFGHYDPLRPEAKQRNAVLGDAELVGPSPVIDSVYGKIGVRGRSQIRVLVCDGPMLLGWVGCFREEPLRTRERALLARLVPALRRTLGLLHGLAAGAAARALDAAMDEIAAPAFILGARAFVAYANDAGLRLLAARRADTMSRLAAALASPAAAVAGGISITPVSAPGAPPLYFAVLRVGRRGELELGAAVSRWRLTPREKDVLALLAHGDANKDIATKLGCAVSTVEIHVGSILRKSRSESRAQVVARVWSGADST